MRLSGWGQLLKPPPPAICGMETCTLGWAKVRKKCSPPRGGGVGTDPVIRGAGDREPWGTLHSEQEFVQPHVGTCRGLPSRGTGAEAGIGIRRLQAWVT